MPLHVVPRQLQPSRGFPLQFTQSGEQESMWHWPAWQEEVQKYVEHGELQAPQLLTSVWVSTHLPLQLV